MEFMEMQKKQNKKHSQKNELLNNDFFSENFKNLYHSMQNAHYIEHIDIAMVSPGTEGTSKVNLPNILTFDSSHNEIENKDTKRRSDNKYGIKTMLQNKSKYSYPVEMTIPNKDVDKYIQQESLFVNENYIEVEIPESKTQLLSGSKIHEIPESKTQLLSGSKIHEIPESKTQLLSGLKNQEMPESKTQLLSGLKNQEMPESKTQLLTGSKTSEHRNADVKQDKTRLLTDFINQEKSEPKKQNDSSMADKAENLSDIIIDNMNRKNKKIDIKTDDNIDIITKIVMNTPNLVEQKPVEKIVTEENVKATKETITPETAKSSESKTKSIDNVFSEIQETISEIKTTSTKNQPEWSELTIDQIGTSFKVIADLPERAKLKIVDGTHLAEDTDYSLLRQMNGQNREKIISFLDHLFHETERNIWKILDDIRKGTNADTNVSIFQGVIGKTHNFLHKYENMRNVYKNDSSAYARLGIIRDKFFTFLNTLYRDILIPKWFASKN